MNVVIHLTFMLGSCPMFLASLHDTNAFSLYMGGNLSARRAALEAELFHLADFSGVDFMAVIEGRYIILTGRVANQRDFYRALDIATDIAGADKLIFRVTYIPALVA